MVNLNFYAYSKAYLILMGINKTTLLSSKLASKNYFVLSDTFDQFMWELWQPKYQMLQVKNWRD